MTGQPNPDARAVFLAALEYGVSPIARADYAKRLTLPELPTGWDWRASDSMKMLHLAEVMRRIKS